MPLACLAVPSALMTASPLPNIFEAQLFHDPTMLAHLPFGGSLGPSDRFTPLFFCGRGLGGVFSPPETDLFILPTLPPVLPCADDGDVIVQAAIVTTAK
jgi:hypothetical protein